MIQILQVAKDTTNVTKEVVSAIASGHTNLIIEKLIDMCISAGKNILIAIIRLHCRTFSYLTYPTRNGQYVITPESRNQYSNFSQKFS